MSAESRMQNSAKSLWLTLALIASLSFVAWFGVRALRQSNRVEAAERRVQQLATLIEVSDFTRMRESVRGLSLHPLVARHLMQADQASETVQALLLQARLSAMASIVYVMDANGVVKSSTSEQGQSLVGHDYHARPYFQQAIAGNPGFYGAIGQTTRKRGLYFSSPVTVQGRPIGVVAAKLDAEALERRFAQMREPLVLESDEHVVFATNRPDWLYYSTSPLAKATLARIYTSRQFLETRIDALPFDLMAPVVAIRGSNYSPIRIGFQTVSGFSLVMLDPVRAYPLTLPQRQFVIGAGVTVFLLGGLVVALMIAIQRRDLAREQLLQTEEHLARTLDGLDDAVLTTDRHGIITRVNPAAIHLAGLSEEQVLRRGINEIFRRDLSRSSESPRKSTPSALLGESTLVTQSGKTVHVIERVAPLVGRDESPMGFVHVLHDTSEERQLREQLQQAQKMEAVGRLAGGVAHDFNNLLMAITGNAELVHIRLGEHRVTPFVKEIIQAATHASELTRQLLAFSRKTAIRTAPMDAHAVIGEALSLLRRGLDPKIIVTVELAATHSVIIGDSTQLQSALLNLFINARDAMPEGGVLRVTTCNKTHISGLGRAATPMSGLEIIIEDNGVGIPESVRSRIFEPFFTTKAEGHGTGLGLAAVYRCVQSHKGHISVESAERVGSTFRIWFPSSDTPIQVQVPPRLRTSAHGGHLILADDDVSVRAFAEDALRLLGYDVTTCDSGACAISCCEKLGSAVAACLLDFRMPGPTGQRLVQQLRAIVPDVPVLFVSGNSDANEDELLRIPNVSFLAKPYRLTELGDAIDRLLDASHGHKRAGTSAIFEPDAFQSSGRLEL